MLYKEYDNGNSYFGVNSAPTLEQVAVKWGHWLSGESLRVERVAYRLLAYPWADLSPGQQSFTFTSDGQYSRWYLLLSVSAAGEADSLEFVLDGEILPWESDPKTYARRDKDSCGTDHLLEEQCTKDPIIVSESSTPKGDDFSCGHEFIASSMEPNSLVMTNEIDMQVDEVIGEGNELSKGTVAVKKNGLKYVYDGKRWRLLCTVHNCTRMRTSKSNNCTKHSNTKFECYLCKKQLNRNSLSQHMTVHLIGHNKTNMCYICNVAFAFRFQLRFHLDTHLYGPRKCEICNKSYYIYSSYTTHLCRHGKKIKLASETKVFQSEINGTIVLKTTTELPNVSHFYFAFYGMNGKITDHVVGFTQLKNVHEAANARFKNAKTYSTIEMKKRYNANLKRKRFEGCGSIRDLKSENKTIMSVVPIQLYGIDDDVLFLIKSFIRLRSKAHFHAYVTECLESLKKHNNFIVNSCKNAIENSNINDNAYKNKVLENLLEVKK